VWLIAIRRTIEFCKICLQDGDNGTAQCHEMNCVAESCKNAAQHFEIHSFAIEYKREPKASWRDKTSTCNNGSEESV